MTRSHTPADRLSHALALTSGGLDALADAASICDLRACIAYADELLADGTALAVAPAGGWLMELALTLGRVPTVLEVEARRSGTWWAVLGYVYERAGVAGLITWGVPNDMARSVEAELLEDMLHAPTTAGVGA